MGYDNSDGRSDASGSVRQVRFNGPIFLVGLPRSGTKLLRDMLNRHPRVRIPAVETELLPWIVRHAGQYGDLSVLSNFRRFYARVVCLPYFTYKAADGHLPSAEVWHAACQHYDSAAIFQALLRIDIGVTASDKIIWGDKSPSYVEHLPLIRSVYPKARILHIIRDVRDYCLSINKAWRKDMLRAAQRWADGVDAARLAGRAMGPDYMEILYEHLLSDPEAQLRRVCQFVEVAFDPAMLSLDRPSENIGDAKGIVGVLSGNSGKYLKGIPSDLLADIEAISGDVLLECGYALTHALRPRRRLSRLELRTAQLRDGYNLVLSAREQRGLVGAVRFYWRYFRATRAF